MREREARGREREARGREREARGGYIHQQYRRVYSINAHVLHYTSYLDLT